MTVHLYRHLPVGLPPPH